MTPETQTEESQPQNFSRLLTTTEVEAFEALSKEVFNATSKWATILKKGMRQVVTEKVTEYVPAEGDKPEQMLEHDLPVYLDKAKKSVKMYQRYFSPEELMVYMVERKKQIDAIKAMIAQAQAEQKAKQEQEALAKQVAQQVSGEAKQLVSAT